MLHLRSALLGLAITGLTVLAQTPPTTPPARPATTPPAGTVPTTAPKTPAAPAVSPTAVAVTVNGEAIYEQAVQRALDRVPPARRAEERPRLLNYLIDNLLIDQSLRTAGYKVDNTEVDKRIGDMKAELKKQGKDFDKMLGEFKVTEAELRTHISADLRWYKYASAQATDKVLTDFFTANKDMFDGTTVKARHILLTPAGKDEKAVATSVAQIRQLKAAIEKEVETGLAKLPATADKLAREKARTEMLVESFAKIAKEKSDCPSKNNGGDVGFFQKVGFMVEAFSRAAFALAPYQMSDAVVSPFGCHLILVTERKPGRDVKFEEVKEVVKDVVFERERERLTPLLRQKATIVVNPAPK
jgi:peptidyl-prolyl cis-trans isomerase C